MSNIYNTEPATEGKILFHTSFGDLDIELWPMQAPKACRNFVQLCLEGYYDNTIFHRLIPNFMIQGGDPTGTGKGGESIYGEAFNDEFHSRLRFTHRGLLAMANENCPNSNHSQFFFTLDACDFLQKKHTIFGKITGNTIFNLLSVSNLETDATNDRPVNAPRLLKTEVLWNPFDDIIPREIASTTKTTKQSASQTVRKGINNSNLLSFGDEESESSATVLKKVDCEFETKPAKVMRSSHDVLEDKHLKQDVDPDIQAAIDKAKRKVEKSKLALEKLKAKASAQTKVLVTDAMSDECSKAITKDSSHESSDDESTAISEESKKTTKSSRKRKKSDDLSALDEYTQLRQELRKSNPAIPVIVGDKAQQLKEQEESQEVLAPSQQNRKKLFQRRKSRMASRQAKTLQRLQEFRRTLAKARAEAKLKEKQIIKEAHPAETISDTTKNEEEGYHGQLLEQDSDKEETETSETGASSTGLDFSWMASKLKFKKHIDDQYRSALHPVDDYVTIDTRKTQGR
ncbi:unnamed protein product [Albugo candida]|uniref:PPIase cyclophilin-type domain-containing protein n=1 Tax=Albugo candida TaxID=65357 RepID=A0A024G1G9_9STRA|nr:unnamed protein product [Albugo candida]|eukprot:CCI40500.1 unnamed protein product [Albugo candida]